MTSTNNQSIMTLKKPDSLKHKVVKGGFWVFSVRGIQQVFNIIRLIVLARVLAPDDFGVLGIALLVMMTLETFTQTGFQHALIQKKKDIRPYLDAAWTVLIIRGIIIFSILFLIAPFAAGFFETSIATTVIQVIGFSVLFQAGVNIGVVYFQKDLEFKKYFIFQISGTLADFIIAISAAIILKNVWALVYGLVGGNAVRFIVSYFIHPYKPRFSTDLAKAKELWGFGKWVLGASILTFLLTQGDVIFVGKLLGVTLLGFYTMAYKFSNMPTTEITHVISEVTFPAYSKLQDQIKKIRDGYLRVLQSVTVLSFLLGGLIIALGPEFTELFLGKQWMPMVPALLVLVIWGLTRSIGACTGPLFKAVGRPDLSTKMMAFRFSILIIIIYPFTIRWGIVGTALSVALVGLITRPITDYLVVRIIKCPAWEYAKILVVPLFCLEVMVLVIWLLKYYVFAGVGYVIFFVLALIGFAIYMAILLIFDKVWDYGIMDTVKNYLWKVIK